MKNNMILKSILSSIFCCTVIFSDDNSFFTKATETAKSVLFGIQNCRRKITAPVKERISKFFRVAEEEQQDPFENIENEPIEIRQIKAMIAALEHDRLNPTCPPVLHALRWYEDANPQSRKNFYRLLSDPATDVNIIDDQRSLLHFVYYRHDKNYGLDMLRAILQRPDLIVDQKGNGIGDYGDTVLGLAVHRLIFLKGECTKYIRQPEQKEIDRVITSIELLLAKGANPQLMSQRTKQEFFQHCQTDSFDDLVAKLKKLK